MDLYFEPYWRDVGHLVAWLDAHPALYGDALQWRVGKIVEEVGEAQAALGAIAQQNPRKTGITGNGISPTARLAAELCDVIITASVALHTLTPAPAEQVAARIDAIRERITPQGEPA